MFFFPRSFQKFSPFAFLPSGSFRFTRRRIFLPASWVEKLWRDFSEVPAEPSERPPQSPLRGKFPRRASRRVVPLGWWPSGTFRFANSQQSERKQTQTNADKCKQTQRRKRKQTQANVSKRGQTQTNINKRLHPPFIAVFYTPPLQSP